MEIYDNSIKLAEIVKEYNCNNDYYQKILDAVYCISTGSESLMKLRFYLDEILKDKKLNNNDEIVLLTKEIILNINKIMK